MDDIFVLFGVAHSEQILAVLMFMYFGIGPITSALLNYFGFRITGTIGAVIIVIGIFSAAHSNSFKVLLITFGVISGIGFGIVGCTSILVVGHYFDRFRALACALAVNGGGVGTVIMGQIIPLFKDFQWRNKFMIFSGFFILLFPLVITYRSIKPRSVKVAVRPRVSFANLSSSDSSTITVEYTNQMKWRNFFSPSVNQYPSEVTSEHIFHFLKPCLDLEFFFFSSTTIGTENAINQN